MGDKLQEDFQTLQEHIGHISVKLSNAVALILCLQVRINDSNKYIHYEIKELQTHLGNMSTLLSKAVNAIIELQDPINHFDQCADCGEDIDYSNRYCQKCATEGVYDDS